MCTPSFYPLRMCNIKTCASSSTTCHPSIGALLAGLLVGVTFLSLLLSLLIFLVLRSRSKAVCFLHKQQVRAGSWLAPQ